MPTKRTASSTKKHSNGGAPVFADRARGGARFTVSLTEATGAPHQLVVMACYGSGAGKVELFRVNQGNSFIAPKPAAVTTGLVEQMRAKGLIALGRVVGEWKSFLVGA